MNGATQPVNQFTKILILSKHNPIFVEGGAQHFRIGSPHNVSIT